MKNMKTLREAHGLSQKDLAEVLHITQQAIYKYEQGLCTPSLSILQEMSAYFQTSIDYLTSTDAVLPIEEHLQNYSLNSEEAHLIRSYRCMSLSNRHLVNGMISKYAMQKN